ncbi:MAG: FxLYD domain-containing protein [Actinomycetota bacterium]
MRCITRRVHRTTSLAAGLLLCGLLTACEYSEINGVGTRTADEVNPPQLDVTAFDGCRPATLNRWQVEGEVTNSTDSVATYEVVVGFYEGDTRIDERGEWVRNLRPGERASLDRAWWIDDPERVTDCRLLLVNRFG